MLRQLGVKVKPEERLTNQRITSEEIASLKQAVGNKGLAVKLKQQFSSIVHDLLFALAPVLPRLCESSVCRRYGHVIDAAQWTEYFPKCRDCGKTIRSQVELRSAYPKCS